jgi:2-polyprenyl-3-methyl-5-hydroxy-6-metoxy-1,4-benzoquinol methylase
MAEEVANTRRSEEDPLFRVQEGNRAWWERTPMTYDWRGDAEAEALSLAWYDDQDRRNAATHAHFATRETPFDRLIPFADLCEKRVLEIGVGSGYHAELLARAGAHVTGIDLTDAAIARTLRRFELKGLAGTFERRDAEEPAPDFEREFDFIWSWGVIHHSARTARIVRNVSRWLKDSGSFHGMVYHRDSLVALASVLRRWVLQRRMFRESVDEALWRTSDGYSARFYPRDQWRDLLLAFFENAHVEVTGQLSDAVPAPRALRLRVEPLVSRSFQERVVARAGTFLVFRASAPLR